MASRPTEEVPSVHQPIEGPGEGPNEDALQFMKLLEDANQPYYEGCKHFSKLSVIVHLYHMKCLNDWTNKSFTMLLQFLLDFLHSNAKLPKDCYEAKKIIKDLGLSYEKIHACPKDCILYWKDNSNLEACPNYNLLGWESNESKGQQSTNASSKRRKKKAAKILRWFPLKPRLKRLFMSPETANHMKWHANGRVNDGLMRHPADSEAWKLFDSKYIEFSSEPCNVRLGLVADGFNPYGNMSTTHSTWPVILIPYNLPPWMCMKRPYFMLSLLIPGPTSPENDIDVYLQPLVEELKELWDVGVETFDVSPKKSFQMHVALLWTINDFPAYGDILGWSTKGRLPCPSCNYDSQSRWLRYGRKFSYIGHKRFLDRDHKFRKQKKLFDGRDDMRPGPITILGGEIMLQMDVVAEHVFGKKKVNLTNKRKRGEDALTVWKKRNIFFTLPYWGDHVLRYNLNVMHIEKNVVDNIFGTLLNLDGKTKDNLKACQDLKDMGIRSRLHLEKVGNDQTRMPHDCYHMNASENDGFLQVLKDVRVPDGYSSNISRCVKLEERKISGMKSHDNYILMQQLFPIAIHGSLSPEVSRSLIELSCFFRDICLKVLNVEELKALEKRIAVTLCELERTFPPSFFTVMVHLVMHLASEAKVVGPVHYRWMYPIERYLSRLKSYVHNKTYPEGSIAEGYIAEKCLTFCSRYFKSIEIAFNRPVRNVEESMGAVVMSMDVSKRKELSDKVRWFARYPDNEAKWFKRYVINGLKFRTKDFETIRKTQNSGVCVVTEGDATYYSVLIDIIELNYSNKYRYILFKCQWANVIRGRGCKKDDFGFLLVNFSRLIHKDDRLIDEPYVLASQVSQVFYVEDVRHKDWVVVVQTKPREVFDIGIKAIDDDEEVDTYMENVLYNVTIDDACDDANDNHAWARVDEEGTIYDTSLISEDEFPEQDFIDDEELSDDIYESNGDESNDDGSSDDE
ncbi:uncharacterized protein LOC142639540 [Castanea sativa]|uniref:uncharacterized protein LOC142639540 n=1 Tax=Castanea sativa TaxID=21020 RepID=UPI003F650811